MTTSRPVLDPNKMQRMASDPAASVWVNASAGTGKTKVLTDRLIRLMLPRDTGEDGTAPHRILCLTYTKAGAGEMLNRIMKTLAEWAAMGEDALHTKLTKDVLGQAPTPDQMRKARALFAEVVDTPGGIKIMTIHSFCQSLLGRFPIEAQLPPDFALMVDDEAKDMIRRARDHVLHDILVAENASTDKSNTAPNQRLHDLLLMFTKMQNSDQIISLLDQIIRQRQKIQTAFKSFGGVQPLIEAVYELHDLPAFAEAQDVTQMTTSKMQHNDLVTLAEWFHSSTGKRDVDKAVKWLAWLKQAGSDEASYTMGQLDELAKIMLPHHMQCPNKALKEARPDLHELYLSYCQMLLDAGEIKRRLDTCQKTEIVLCLAQRALDSYHLEKQKSHKLDYDDLILKTVDLVKHAPQWVMYKLDGGIDHILVDEAQDSNPDQWIIIDALIQEFFAGVGQDDGKRRTLFVVGDEKQSIFGFQGSDPDVFQKYRQNFAAHFKAAELAWRDQPLNISFRSVQAVLDIVDHSFSGLDKKVALTGNSDGDIEHDAFRVGQAGQVTLWPLVKAQDPEAPQAWAKPDLEDTKQIRAPQAILAQNIAAQIKDWLQSGEILPSTQIPIRAGDIMILVRNRNNFVDHMIRALKDADIPVSGVDRMVLNAQIAVQDLMALAKFALLPDDDLALASALKSPLIGLTEDDLFTLCYGRQGSLWHALKKAAQNAAFSDQNISYPALVTWLTNLINRARIDGVYDFFSQILLAPCPANSQSSLRAFIGRLGEDALDPIEEFISRSFDFDLMHRSDLQHFLHLFENNEESIKRELDEGQDVVRIMTVHGSKGLQAPIVFLPDTIVTGHEKSKTNKFLWCDNKTTPDNAALPLWSNSATDASSLYQEARDALFEKSKQEYDRLLYVALTRAEDRLYIAGCLPTTKTKPLEHSWYHIVESAMSNHPDMQALPAPSYLNFSQDATDEKEAEILVYKTQQSDDAKIREMKPLLSIDLIDKGNQAAILTPAFLQPPAAEPENPSRPLQPSRPSDDEELAALSPLKASGTNKRFRRGNIIHALLQFLPDTAPDHRRTKAQDFLQSNMPEQNNKQINALLDEVFDVLEHPEYAALFGTGSKAEAPITGMMTDAQGMVNVVSGQIDRLIVDDAAQTVMIVDYKTNRPAPRHEADIPMAYRRQMHAYRVLLQQIYEGYDIKTYLLWTDYAAMMRVPDL